MVMEHEFATLFVVATPIGNIGDVSQRALQTLQEVELVAAEDTRNTGLLLKRLGLSRQMVALHEHNERAQTERLLALLTAGQSIALVSDAGTPLINDPGFRLVDAALEGGIRVVPIPGPSSIITALCVSGQPTDRFCFEGFLPSKSTQRKRVLRALADETRTMVFFESPHRVLDSLRDFVDVFGTDRSITVARELTKKFETVKRGSLEGVVHWMSSESMQTRGEFVLVVAGAKAMATDKENEFERTLLPLLEELSLSKAVDLTAKICEVPRNRVYRRALALKSDSS